MLLSVEILLNAANLAFVAFSKVHGDVTGPGLRLLRDGDRGRRGRRRPRDRDRRLPPAARRRRRRVVRPARDRPRRGPADHAGGPGRARARPRTATATPAPGDAHAHDAHGHDAHARTPSARTPSAPQARPRRPTRCPRFPLLASATGAHADGWAAWIVLFAPLVRRRDRRVRPGDPEAPERRRVALDPRHRRGPRHHAHRSTSCPPSARPRARPVEKIVEWVQHPDTAAAGDLVIGHRHPDRRARPS